MVYDLRHVGPDLVSVGGHEVLPKQRLDAASGLAASAVRRRQHVAAVDEGAAAPDEISASDDQTGLPRVLVDLRLFTAHDAGGAVDHPATAVLRRFRRRRRRRLGHVHSAFKAGPDHRVVGVPVDVHL